MLSHTFVRIIFVSDYVIMYIFTKQNLRVGISKNFWTNKPASSSELELYCNRMFSWWVKKISIWYYCQSETV